MIYRRRYQKINYAGIDAGIENTKVVILKGEREYDWAISPGGIEYTATVAEKVLKQAVEKAGIKFEDIDYIVATGVGREFITSSDKKVPEFLCLARGIDFLLPSTRTLLDLGAQKSLALKCIGGKVIKMATSSKCAAGTGSYLQVAANVLGINVNEIADLFFKSKENLEIQSTCAVFAESEIISLVHAGARPEDIARGIFSGLAGRVYTQLLELGIEKDVTIVGGVARSKAIVAALEEKVFFQIMVPENPDIVGALGAALIAQTTRSVT